MTILVVSLLILAAAGIPTAFLFGREMGREDEKAELPELQPGAEVRFRPRHGVATRYAVQSVTQALNGPTVVVMQDLVSARMVKRKTDRTRAEMRELTGRMRTDRGGAEDPREPLDDAMRNYGGRA